MSAAELERARALLLAGRHPEARQAVVRALGRAARDASAHAEASAIFSALGEPERALFYAEKCAALAPDDARAHYALAEALLACRRPADALDAIERSLGLDPASLESLLSHTHVLSVLRRWSDAESAARHALTLHPDEPRLAGNLAACLTETGRARAAVDLLRAARERRPDDLHVATSLAQACTYAEGLSSDEVRAAHDAYNALLHRLSPAEPAAHANSPDPSRPLRVGFLSADLRWHPVGLFLETLLRALPRERVRVVCYSASGAEDDVSRRLRALADDWRVVAHASIGELAAAVRRDGIDILIDLAGHTAGSRLPAMHLRPAPVQATWLGYLNTTGLSRIDHRLVDAHTDPPSADRWSAESLARLEPAFLCYTPHPDAPSVPPARDPDALFTFGSFNALSKLSDGAVSLWARVLQRVPESRLVLRHTALGEPDVRRDTVARFSALGVDPARILPEPPVATHRELFAAYARLDVALDPFPFNGGTTTCEALLAGVPVLTLPGERSCSRVGLSLLTSAGLPECVARDEAHFLELAEGFARDPQRLASLRARLPDRVRASALCDAPRFAASFEHTLRTMWETWCARRRTEGDAARG